MVKHKWNVKYVILAIVIIMACLGAIYFWFYSKTKETAQEERIPPYPYDEKVITFVPYEKDVETISLEEQIEIVAKNSGAGIIVITTYEEREKDLKDNFQDEAYDLIKREDIPQVEIDGHNRYILQGDIIHYLYK